MISIEQVTGNKDGITQVKSTLTLVKSGGFKVESAYFKKDKWIMGSKALYKPAPNAKLID